MTHLSAIFALIVAAAGWYYLFYSKAASRLAGIEGDQQNRLRVRLRRIGGLVIILLGGLFYALLTLDERETRTALLLLTGVFLLMLVLLVLGLVDLRLTRRMRRNRKRWNP
jgi:UDP-N-acetylmuramyl pentapeptide phosphotransferase/UDP-N-acetylglucosamine-1-phosphate transferase